MVTRTVFALIRRKFFRFAFVGASGSVLNLMLLYVFTEFFSLYYLLAGLAGAEIALTWNFIFNDAWTWGREKKKHSFLQRYFRYWMISHGVIMINMALLYFFTDVVGLYYLFSMVFAILVGFLVNYWFNRQFTFRPV